MTDDPTTTPSVRAAAVADAENLVAALLGGVSPGVSTSSSYVNVDWQLQLGRGAANVHADAAAGGSSRTEAAAWAMTVLHAIDRRCGNLDWAGHVAALPLSDMPGVHRNVSAWLDRPGRLSRTAALTCQDAVADHLLPNVTTRAAAAAIRRSYADAETLIRAQVGFVAPTQVADTVTAASTIAVTPLGAGGWERVNWSALDPDAWNLDQWVSPPDIVLATWVDAVCCQEERILHTYTVAGMTHSSAYGQVCGGCGLRRFPLTTRGADGETLPELVARHTEVCRDRANDLASMLVDKLADDVAAAAEAFPEALAAEAAALGAAPPRSSVVGAVASAAALVCGTPPGAATGSGNQVEGGTEAPGLYWTFRTDTAAPQLHIEGWDYNPTNMLTPSEQRGVIGPAPVLLPLPPFPPGGQRIPRLDRGATVGR